MKWILCHSILVLMLTISCSSRECIVCENPDLPGSTAEFCEDGGPYTDINGVLIEYDEVVEVYAQFGFECK